MIEFANHLPRTARNGPVSLSGWACFTDELGLGPLSPKIDDPKDCEQVHVGRFYLDGFCHPAFLASLVTVTYYEDGSRPLLGATEIDRYGKETLICHPTRVDLDKLHHEFYQCLRVVDTDLQPNGPLELTNDPPRRNHDAYRYVRDSRNNWHAVPAGTHVAQDGSRVVLYSGPQVIPLSSNYTFPKTVELLTGRTDFLFTGMLFEPDNSP